MSVRQWAPRIREQLAERGLATRYALDRSWLTWDELPETRGVLSLWGSPRGGFEAFISVRYEPAMAIYGAISGITQEHIGLRGLVSTRVQPPRRQALGWEGSPNGISAFVDEVMDHGFPWVEAHGPLDVQERVLREEADTNQGVELAALLLSQDRRDEALAFMAEVRERTLIEAAALVPYFDEQIAAARTIDVDRVQREWILVR